MRLLSLWVFLSKVYSNSVDLLSGHDTYFYVFLLHSFSFYTFSCCLYPRFFMFSRFFSPSPSAGRWLEVGGSGDHEAGGGGSGVKPPL